MQEGYGIAAFRSRQQVLMFEQALRREGMNVKIVTTPRDVALGCGLSVKFDMKDAPRVLAAANRTRPGGMVGVYHAAPSQGRTKVTALRLG